MPQFKISQTCDWTYTWCNYHNENLNCRNIKVNNIIKCNDSMLRTTVGISQNVKIKNTLQWQCGGKPLITKFSFLNKVIISLVPKTKSLANVKVPDRIVTERMKLSSNQKLQLHFTSTLWLVIKYLHNLDVGKLDKCCISVWLI